MSAPCTVMGMKMLDSPMLLWSRKFLAWVCEGLGVVERGAGDAGERWRLVKVTIEPAEDPVEFRDDDGDANAGIDGVFGYGPGEVGLAFAGDQREPVGGLVVVLDVGFLNAGGDDRIDGEVRGAEVVEDGAEDVVFMLGLAVDAGRECILRDNGERDACRPE